MYDLRHTRIKDVLGGGVRIFSLRIAERRKCMPLYSDKYIILYRNKVEASDKLCMQCIAHLKQGGIEMEGVLI